MSKSRHHSLSTAAAGISPRAPSTLLQYNLFSKSNPLGALAAENPKM
jgi:hypothetical protein